MKSPIGLDTVQSQALAAELNNLLASYQILYMNVRGFHWNIRGNQFFELHLKFEEIYNDHGKLRLSSFSSNIGK